MADNTARDSKGITRTTETSTESIDNVENGISESFDSISGRDAFIQEQTQCCLCGHELSFDHAVDFHQLTVIESASCEPCKIQLRKQLFTLN